MADRFPDISKKTVDLVETHINYFFDHLTACVHNGRGPGELCYPNAVAIDSSNSQIYVTEGFYFSEGNPINIARVSIFSETGEFLNTFSHPHMKKPWGIAIHRDNIYITDKEEHFVLHFKVEAEYHLVARLGGRGFGIGQFNEPKQLAVSTDGDVFVADRKNNRVQILDGKLHYRRHISHHSMALPLDVKLTPDKVYVLCEASPCIHVFSYIGDLIRSLITGGAFGMKVSSLSIFCLDADGNLLLNDCWRHRIKLFSKEGTLLRTLGKYGHEVGKLAYPQGIALTCNQKLIIVSRNNNYSLQIYSSF